MKVSKIVVSFWLATAAFCLLQVFFGPAGVLETARLREHSRLLEVRLSELRLENQVLTARYEALLTRKEAVRLEARSLGWFAPGETPVRILDGAGFHLPSDEPDLSAVPPLGPERADSSLFFRIAWPLLFVLFYSFFLLMERLWPQERRLFPVFRGSSDNLPVPLQTGLDFFRK